MRHRLAGRKLGRTTAHRQALERNIVQSLFIYGRIITTEAKAKEFRGTAEHLIQLGKVGDLPARRRILRTVQDPRLAKKIIDDVAKRFTDRQGGYTRVVKLGVRAGDAAPVSIVELVDRGGATEETGKKKPQRRRDGGKQQPAAKQKQPKKRAAAG